MAGAETAEELYVTWRKRLLAYFGKTVSYRDAEDLTHDLFVRFLNAEANGTNISQPRRWLWRAARNMVIDIYRERRLDCTLLEEEESLDRLTPEPLDLALDWDDRTDVVRCLPALTPVQQEAVLLRHRDGWEYWQVADAMGISLHAAKGRHRRAIDRLRVLMAEAQRRDSAPAGSAPKNS